MHGVSHGSARAGGDSTGLETHAFQETQLKVSWGTSWCPKWLHCCYTPECQLLFRALSWACPVSAKGRLLGRLDQLKLHIFQHKQHKYLFYCFLVRSLLLIFFFFVADDSHLDEIWVLSNIDAHHPLHHHPLLTILSAGGCGESYPEFHEANPAVGREMCCTGSAAPGIHQHVPHGLSSASLLGAEMVSGAHRLSCSTNSWGKNSILLHPRAAWKWSWTTWNRKGKRGATHCVHF